MSNNNLKTRIRTVLRLFVQNRQRYYAGRGYKRMSQQMAISKILSHLEYYERKSTQAHCIMMRQVGSHIETLKPERYEHDKALSLYATLQNLQKEAYNHLHGSTQTTLQL